MSDGADPRPRPGPVGGPDPGGEPDGGAQPNPNSPSDPCKELRKRLDEHLKKLRDYRDNPDRFDNKNILPGKSPEIRQRIIDGRIRNLENQIRDFRKQIHDKCGG